MNASENIPLLKEQETNGTILWLTGWSMPDVVFDRLRLLLPDFRHISVDYSAANSPEDMLCVAETAVSNILFVRGSAGTEQAIHGPLLVSGWSLGGLLALRLAAKGCVDGLVLFGATARFTRSKEEFDRGLADAYVRQMIKGVSRDRHVVETNFRKMMFTELEWEGGLAERLPQTGSWTTQALLAGLQILRSEECLSQLPHIDCPVLLIHGTEDKICPYGAALELTAQLPHAKLITLTACGHAPFWGREVQITDEWRRWWYGL
ncbi:alpha/beta fold hydrolase [Paenibacillus sp. JNUCC31]|uniref:alpha/beta fold hydrolase n=1 Tax=Paenibacillus sp. JNUCC-31 TaxID=2777983 RepID=UPI001786A8CA|nr:alpha/beta fold hydrolase [Paenibacillus sp. JNUCC-31]QOS76880.1 alpha/beta fold hydrolase [Paenibacillus sp. JNUCC-31]